MKLNNVRADLHTHGWCGQETGTGQFVLRILGETGERNLAELSRRGFSETQNTLIGLVNFGDTRYQKIVNTRGQLGKNFEVYDDNRKRFIGVHHKALDSWCFVLRGQEIPTDKGHVLILGNDQEIKYTSLDEVIKSAEDMETLVVADHPLAEKGLAGNIFSLIRRDKKPLSLGEKTLRKHTERFDAIEIHNSNFPELSPEIAGLAQELHKQGFVVSDSHDLRRKFSSYMEYPELDFGSWESLRDGLLNQERYPVKGTNRKFEKYLHGLAVAYNIARQITGLVKMPRYEIE